MIPAGFIVEWNANLTANASATPMNLTGGGDFVVESGNLTLTTGAISLIFTNGPTITITVNGGTLERTIGARTIIGSGADVYINGGVVRGLGEANDGVIDVVSGGNVTITNGLVESLSATPANRNAVQVHGGGNFTLSGNGTLIGSILGGTVKGADTAIVIVPSHTNNSFGTQIKEIICVPRERCQKPQPL